MVNTWFPNLSFIPGVFLSLAVGGLVFYRKLRKAGEPDPEANEAGFSLSEMRRLVP